MRRQWPALLLVPVLAAASVLWTLRLDWFPYLDDQPRDVTTVAAGESGAYARTGFTVTETRRVDGSTERGEELGVAPDATLVIASLDVEPAEGLGSCTIEAVDGETRWDTAGFTETEYSVPDRFESYCATDATEPYALQLTYVVPTEVAGEVELEVSDRLLLPSVLRLELGS